MPHWLRQQRLESHQFQGRRTLKAQLPANVATANWSDRTTPSLNNAGLNYLSSRGDCLDGLEIEHHCSAWLGKSSVLFPKYLAKNPSPFRACRLKSNTTDVACHLQAMRRDY